MAKHDIILDVSNISREELVAVFPDCAYRGWTRYIYISPRNILYLHDIPIHNSDRTILISEDRWAEIVLIKDKLSNNQLINYLLT